MEKLDKKGKEMKEKKWSRKLELPMIMGSQKKEVAFDDDVLLASPRDVFGVPVSGTDSDSTASSIYCGPASPEMGPDRALAKDGQTQQWKTMMDVLRLKSVRRFSSIPLLTASYEISRRSLRNKLSRIRPTNEDDDLDAAIDIDGIPTKPSWRNFNYADLAAATDDFNPENMIGKGGHAEVYKGCLPDGQVVAVKRLTRNDEDRAGDFLSELGIIAHVNHPNATRLIGFGIDQGLYFVLQLAPHGSLASMLFGAALPLSLTSHFVSSFFNAESISDFGLAKWLPDKWAHHVVFPIEGTFG
ncbi:unnamed protein product [Sphenostylis stenocarpa]|uniref:Protein kinase domain-containing protein n=1 Tax=Sphenostylis stenocarpa TaxID=92480 RepID=A0AA86S5L6_9FABA|nr:unnamed protein product [Sphenostylis stenocarpa]